MSRVDQQLMNTANALDSFSCAGMIVDKPRGMVPHITHTFLLSKRNSIHLTTGDVLGCGIFALFVVHVHGKKNFAKL